jgi:hypothetical protein
MAIPRHRGLGPGLAAIAAALLGCSANGTERGGDDPPGDLGPLAPLASLTAPSDLRVPAEWERDLPGLRWAQRLDTSNIIVHADGAGDVVLAASLEVPTSIGGRAVQPGRDRDSDVIVAALTPDGQARWTTVIASSEPDALEDMAVDARGFVTVTGTYGAPLAIGDKVLEPDPILPSESAFLARIAPGGEVVAARGPLDLDYPVVAAAPGGALVASGRGRVDVQKSDERLGPRWSVRCWREDSWGRPALVPFHGGAILAGQEGGWAGVECHDGRRGSTVGGQRNRTFVARILEGGRVGWVEGLPDRVAFAALAASPAGRIAVGVYGRVDGVGEIQVLLLDAEGRGLSVAHLAIEEESAARLAALAVDEAGGVVLAGDFVGRLRVAGSVLESLGRDVFVVRIAPDGTLSWARRLGDEEDQHAVGVAFDGTGGVVVTGMEAVRQSGNHPESDAFVIDLVP